MTGWHFFLSKLTVIKHFHLDLLKFKYHYRHLFYNNLALLLQPNALHFHLSETFPKVLWSDFGKRQGIV